MHRSNSGVQTEAEATVIDLLSRELGGEPLAKNDAVSLDDEHTVRVDGYRPGPPEVFAEVLTRVTALKAGQRSKVLKDALKLAAIGKAREGARLMLVLTSREAAESLISGWASSALKLLGIELRVIELPQVLRETVRAAQELQRR